MEYVEKLIEAGRPELAAELKNTWKNAVMFRIRKDLPDGNIPVGTSKIGGYPDLPPEIPYPEMSGFTREHHFVRAEYKTEIVPESSMQMLAQINLRELAESGADIENRLPKTGMLYFFFSHYGCNVFSDSLPDGTVTVDTPEKAQIAKVIYWDGDLSSLRRTAPTLPYCNGIIPGYENERAVGFFAEDNYDAEMLDDLDEICEILDIEDCELILHGDKLLGVPWTVNPPYMSAKEINLLQMSANEGSVVSYFWAIKSTALAEQDFSSANHWEDCD